MTIQIAPSILAADAARIGDAVRMVEEAGADLIHIDIMDGHFVPNLTFGPQLIASLRKKTSLPLNVHLMVENPDFFIPLFLEAGADWVSFHLEASPHLHRDLSLIKEMKKKAGLALNPGTPVHLLGGVIKELDFVLLMTVNPGWGGQSFIDSCHGKIRQLKDWIEELELDLPVQIDGGVHLENFEQLVQDGTDILVVGAGIFGEDNPQDVLLQMKKIAQRGRKR